MASIRPTTINSARITVAVLAISLLFLSATAHGQLWSGFRKQGAKKSDSSVAAMQEARKAMAEAIQLESKNGRLEFEFPTQENAREISSAIVKDSHGSSSGSSGNHYTASKESDHVKIHFNSGSKQWGERDNNIQLIKLSNLTDTTNQLEVKINTESNDLSVRSTNLSANKIHILRQTKSGITFVAVDNESFEYYTGATLERLSSAPGFHSAFSQLRDAGLGVPKVALQSTIVDAVEAILNCSVEDRDEFTSKFPDLTSVKFKQRKQATEKLSKELGDHVVSVSSLLISEDLPLEMRARILEAIANSEDKDAASKIKTVTDEKLHESTTILTQLLDRQNSSGASQEKLNNTFKQLTKVTGKTFGDDAKAWSEWAKKSETGTGKATPKAESKPSKKEAETETKRNELLSERRKLIREPLKNLLTLKRAQSGGLAIDRGHWNKTFDGRTPDVVVKETREIFEKSGLPKSWLKMGGEYDTAGIGFEQILFERIAESVNTSTIHNTHQNYGQSKTKSLNREMNKDGIDLSLKVHGAGNRWSNKRQSRAFFNFQFRDEAEDLFYVLNEDPKQGFSLFVFSKNGNTVLSLHCDKNGKSSVHHVANGKRTSFAADSIEELVQENETLIKETFVPLLDSIGISAENAF